MTIDAHTASNARLVQALGARDATTDDLAAVALEIGRREISAAGVPERLRALLKHGSAYVREAAAEALGKVHALSAVPELCVLLLDEEQPTEVRDTSAYALGLLGDIRASDALQQLLAKRELPATLRNCAEAALQGLLEGPVLRNQSEPNP